MGLVEKQIFYSTGFTGFSGFFFLCFLISQTEMRNFNPALREVKLFD